MRSGLIISPQGGGLPQPEAEKMQTPPPRVSDGIDGRTLPFFWVKALLSFLSSSIIPALRRWRVSWGMLCYIGSSRRDGQEAYLHRADQRIGMPVRLMEARIARSSGRRVPITAAYAYHAPMFTTAYVGRPAPRRMSTIRRLPEGHADAPFGRPRGCPLLTPVRPVR